MYHTILMLGSSSQRSSTNAKSSSFNLDPNFHLSALRIQQYKVQYPDRGLPLLGKPSATSPTIIKGREKYLRPGMLVCLHLDDGKQTPFCVAKILFLFQDPFHRGAWMRVKWFVNSEGKSIFNGIYRDVHTTEPNTLEENIHLFDSDKLGDVILLHWHAMPLPSEFKQQAILTKNHKLTRSVLRLAKNNTNLEALKLTGQIP